MDIGHCSWSIIIAVLYVSTSAFNMRDHEIKLMNIEYVYGTSIKVIVNTKYCALNDHKFRRQILFIHLLNNIHKLTLASF